MSDLAAIEALAKKALDDDRKISPSPWTMDIDDRHTDTPDFTGKFYYGEGSRSVCLYDQPAPIDELAWIEAARTREPRLASAVLALLPLVQAVRAWRKCYDDEGEIRDRIALGDAEVNLVDAVDALAVMP